MTAPRRSRHEFLPHDYLELVGFFQLIAERPSRTEQEFWIERHHYYYGLTAAATKRLYRMWQSEQAVKGGAK